MSNGAAIEPLGQFKLYPIFGNLGEKLHFTNSPLFMIISCAVVLGFLYMGMRKKAVVPGRLQAAAEIAYEFIEELTMSSIGEKGKAFFPFIFALFFFILAGNYLGLLPYSYTFTSHIVVTLAMALVVFVMAIIVAIINQGPIGFCKHFMPAGAPIFLAPLLVPIEIISYLSRPISLSIRLFANMVAGHVLLEVFASFIIMGLLSGSWMGYIIAPSSFIMDIALMGLELVVGGLQAYVFAMLTAMYLQEACATAH